MSLFNIDRIEYGWFTVSFGNISLTNSDYLGCDAPKYFLGALADIFDGNTSDEWLCWQNEPDARILYIYMSVGMIHAEVYDADEDSRDLPFGGEGLEENISGEPVSASFKATDFLDSVLTCFSLYENGNGLKLYNKHWGDFPQKEFDALKKIAYHIDRTRTEYEKFFFTSYYGGDENVRPVQKRS